MSQPPEDISRRVSELASAYDENQEWEARSVARLIQGGLFGLALNIDSPLRRFVRIHDVEQLQDEEGTYLPHFTVVTESGLRIRISVEPE